MNSKNRYKFGLRLQLVAFVLTLAVITYSVSAFYIYVLYDFVSEYISQELFTIITLILGMIWSGILAYLAGGFLTKPLQQLEQSAIKAANGEIKDDVPVKKGSDEIRGLSLAFNQMLANLREIVGQIEKNFAVTNEGVQQILLTTENTARQAKHIASNIEDISRGAEQSAISIQETAGNVEDLVMLAGEVETKAKTSETLSNEMVQSLTQSSQVFRSLVAGLKESAEKNEHSIRLVQRLEENMKEVEQIAILVGEIANQTNLLALNASIEAARAGEDGRGFAVVAQEVRKLAEQSEHAVKNISSIIQNMHNDVAEVAVQIRDQVEAAREDVSKGQQSERLLEEMGQKILQVAESVKQISNFMKKQMNSIQQTSAQSQEVAAIAEETSAGAQEVTEAVQAQANDIACINELSKQLAVSAERLKKTIERFTY
jgi:methyl-accepting chemotaxis protein